jgi:2-polyprenyl-6-methoxyphenol hydroxylase-like FAD-dependent oxidoreductase
MRIACVGGGPAGLYFAILMKQSDASHDVVVHERRAAAHAGGWGVVFWDDLLSDLQATDAVTAQHITDTMFRW